jgi:hypothetical protein
MNVGEGSANVSHPLFEASNTWSLPWDRIVVNYVFGQQIVEGRLIALIDRGKYEVVDMYVIFLAHSTLHMIQVRWYESTTSAAQPYSSVHATRPGPESSVVGNGWYTGHGFERAGHTLSN